MCPLWQQKEKEHLKAACEILSCLISDWTECTGYLPAHHASLSIFLLSHIFVSSGEKSLIWFSFSNHPLPHCADQPSLLYPHEEYVITGESRPDRCCPGRVTPARAHYQINNPLFFCVWASLKSLTDLSLPLSLFTCLSVLLCFGFFPSGVPDVPGYMVLSNWILGTKSNTTRRWRLEAQLWRRRKCKSVTKSYKWWVVSTYLNWYGISCLDFFCF